MGEVGQVVSRKQKKYTLEDEEEEKEMRGFNDMKENLEEMSSLFNHLPGPQATQNKIEDYLDAVIDDPEDTKSLMTLLSMILDAHTNEEE